MHQVSHQGHTAVHLQELVRPLVVIGGLKVLQVLMWQDVKEVDQMLFSRCF